MHKLQNLRKEPLILGLLVVSICTLLIICRTIYAQTPTFNAWGYVSGHSGTLIDVNYRTIISPFKYAKITTSASTQVKTGAGTLQSIIVSSPGTTWTVQVFDNSTCVAPAIFGATAVTIPAAGTVINFNVDFNTGLCIITSGTAGEITVTYR